MLLEKIKTPGLSHLSYLVGSGGQAAVIDPRRDCAIYVEKARAAGQYPYAQFRSGLACQERRGGMGLSCRPFTRAATGAL